MRQYTRAGQEQPFRSVGASQVTVSTSTPTRLDPSPSAERRVVYITNNGGDFVFIKLADASAGAPSISSTNYHFSLQARDMNGSPFKETIELCVGPEVAVYALANGLTNIPVSVVEM